MFQTIVNMWCTVHSIVLSMANQIRIFPIYTSAMQSEPTVDQIKEINWFPVRQKWCSIEKSLGISKGVMEEVIRTTVPFPENHLNSLCDIHACHIKAMLIKWLNKDQGTGNSERTWITIAKAVKKAGLEEVAFKLLVEGMYCRPWPQL